MFAAARGGWPEQRLVVAFQPHRYTRTRDLFDEFAAVLSTADAVVLTEVYAAGEAPIIGADAKSLARAIRARGRIDPVVAGPATRTAAVLADLLHDGDLLLMMGAGDIGAVASDLARARHPILEDNMHEPRSPIAAQVRSRGRADGRHQCRARGVAEFRRQRARGAARPRRGRARGGRHPGLVELLVQNKVDRVFNILHGNKGGGEDGVLQGLLEALRRAVHRLRRARFGAEHGQDPHQAGLAGARPADAALRRASRPAPTFRGGRTSLGLPVIVKPSCEGSSVGISRVFKAEATCRPRSIWPRAIPASC